MALLALGALALGLLCGLLGPEGGFAAQLAQNSDMVLYLLMFLVGISVGGSREVWRKMRQYHFKALLVPAGIVAGSLAGGALFGLVTGAGAAGGAAVASGLGWYSLSGAILTEMAGAQWGSVAFLSNLLRELLAFFSIPLLAKRLNYASCIAPAAATSEDTTLAMLIRHTNDETVVLAVFNGVVCSALVPVLVPLCWQLAGK